MDSMTNVHVVKELHRKKRSIYIGALILVAGLICLLASMIITPIIVRNSKSLNDLIESDGNKIGKITSVEIFYEPVMVADSSKGDDYYIVSDEKYLYIARMSESFAKTLTKNKVANGYVLKGTSSSVPYEVKEFAVDMYNEAYPENAISMSDFNSLFGDVLIEARKYDFQVERISYYITIALVVIGLLSLLISFLTKRAYEKKMSKAGDSLLSRLDSELNSYTAVYYPNSNFYMTNSYLFNVNNFDLVEINKIFLAYTHIYKRRGVETNNIMKIFDTDANTHDFMHGGFNTKLKNVKAEYDLIYNELYNRNNNIRIGYTPDNLAALKELKKSLK